MAISKQLLKQSCPPYPPNRGFRRSKEGAVVRGSQIGRWGVGGVFELPPTPLTGAMMSHWGGEWCSGEALIPLRYPLFLSPPLPPAHPSCRQPALLSSPREGSGHLSVGPAGIGHSRELGESEISTSSTETHKRRFFWKLVAGKGLGGECLLCSEQHRPEEG